MAHDYQVWISHRTIGSSKPTDYENLDTRQIRRLLRAANVETSGKEEDPALRLMLRYQLECDDALTDDSLMPKKLERCANENCTGLAQIVGQL